jgi:glutathione synthase/RimK-type ligase-like ATP-grasp enzyme
MILCITHSGDYYTIDIVQQALQQKGQRVFRLNTDEFGIRYQLTYSLQASGAKYALHMDNETIYASEITGVWYRKQWSLQVPSDLEPAWQPFFTQEYQTHLQIFFNALTGIPWINDMRHAPAVCRDKLNQLITARQTGLTVPKTIFTNDPATVQDFYSHCQGRVIMKLHSPLSRSMKGDGPSFPTTLLQEQHLAHLQTLAYCPMIFQEYIPKMYELRIVYVAGAFFTGKIPASYHQVTDWRTITKSIIAWEPYELPASVSEKITALMQRLGLSFGAIDVIRKANGDYVFLEVNPFGEWGMLQKYLGYPIGETIAEKLINLIQREQTKNTDHHSYTR